MVKLIVGGKTKCFNLNTMEREHNLFSTWYAMSDMPKYLSKRINITTDKDEHLSYTIGEIEDCIFVDERYVEEKMPELTPESVLFGNSLEKHVDTKETKSIEDLLDKYFPYAKSAAFTDIKKLLSKHFSSLPSIVRDKFFKFASGVYEAGYIIEPNNLVVKGIIKEILLGPDDDDIDKYIHRYVEYRKRGKLC